MLYLFFSKNKMISNIVNYTNILPAEMCKSEEEMLNIDSNAPVVHSSSDREEGDIVNTGEKNPHDDNVSSVNCWP
jgi:hypothetical protein